MYSVNTGNLIHTLSKHSDRVTGIALNPKNPLQVRIAGSIVHDYDSSAHMWRNARVLARVLVPLGY